jgi:hypothetical protein
MGWELGYMRDKTRLSLNSTSWRPLFLLLDWNIVKKINSDIINLTYMSKMMTKTNVRKKCQKNNFRGMVL